MIEFIFMLTRDDVTLPDAREVYASIAETGVRHVGCKDVGLPTDIVPGPSQIAARTPILPWSHVVVVEPVS